MQQQLAGPRRLDVHAVRLRVRRYVHVLQPGCVAVDPHKTVAQIRPPIAHRLDLWAAEHDPGLELLVDEVVVIRAPVDRHVARALVLLRHRPTPASPAPASSPAPAPRPAHTDRLRRAPSTLSPVHASSAV